LRYNPLLKNYFFTDSGNPADFSRRRDLGSETTGLVKKLDLHVDSGRKSVLHLYDVPEEVREEIIEAYDGTKVSIDVARDRELN